MARIAAALSLIALILAGWGIVSRASSQTAGTPLDCTQTNRPGGFILDCQSVVPTEVPSSTASPNATPTTIATVPASTSTPSATPPSTSTATATFTSTSSPTRTPVATATRTSTMTPAPNSNSVAQILYNSDDRELGGDPNIWNDAPAEAPHDGCIAVPGGFSWAKHAHVQTITSTYPQANGWWVLQWDCVAGPTPGVVVHVDNFQAWVTPWVGGGAWTKINSATSWCATMDPPTQHFQGPGCPQSGTTVAMPNEMDSVHGAGDHITVPKGSCIYVAYQVWMTGVGRVLANAGADWWNGSSNVGAVVGRYIAVGPSPRWVSSTTCGNLLLTNPPPLG